MSELMVGYIVMTVVISVAVLVGAWLINTWFALECPCDTPDTTPKPSFREKLLDFRPARIETGHWMEAQLQAAYDEGRRVERERAAFVAERYAQRAAIALRAMDAAPGDLAVRLVLETRKNARRNLSLAEEIAAEIRKGATA